MDTTKLSNKIHDCFYEGERPLFDIENTLLESVRFYPGESALKHASQVFADNCEFMCKYPFWHADDVEIKDSLFTVYARAGIWYGKNMAMKNSLIEAPKMFRRMSGLTIEDCKFTDAGETLWNCSNVTLRNVELKGADYVLMNCENIEIDNMQLQGNYSFQDGKNIQIRNSHLKTKDAFWGTENVTVYDSVLEGQYLGWYSKNLRLVNCTIRSEQPLYYAEGLVLENCRMEESDLCFEYSDVQADIITKIDSVRNPKGGFIKAPEIGEVIIDEHCINPGACEITVFGEK